MKNPEFRANLIAPRLAPTSHFSSFLRSIDQLRFFLFFFFFISFISLASRFCISSFRLFVFIFTHSSIRRFAAFFLSNTLSSAPSSICRSCIYILTLLSPSSPERAPFGSDLLGSHVSIIIQSTIASFNLILPYRHFSSRILQISRGASALYSTTGANTNKSFTRRPPFLPTTTSHRRFPRHPNKMTTVSDDEVPLIQRQKTEGLFMSLYTKKNQ